MSTSGGVIGGIGVDDDFDWSIGSTESSTPISIQEFEQLTMNGAERDSNSRFDADLWLEGRHSQPSHDSLAPTSYSFLGTGVRGQPNQVNDKGYVKQYTKALEDRIQEISKTSTRPCVSNATSLVEGSTVPGSRSGSMWTTDDVVYNLFNMECRSQSVTSLAIYQHKDEILAGLEEHQVLIVEGFTGSGKTTQIPQYILDDFAEKKKLGNIVVTQPRRIAAQSVADRVCKERQWIVGDLVGYQVGLNRNTTEHTRLTYVTTGVLLQTLISKKSLRDYSHIIVDEVHERDLDTDLLILVIKKLMVETADRTTKVILMSATMNAEKFANYFPKWATEKIISESKIIRVPQATFHKVHEYYIDTLERPLGSAFSLQQAEILSHVSEDPKLQSCTYDLAVDVIAALDEFERKLKRGDQRGGVLAFLPGLMEIDTMYKRCAEYMEKRIVKNNGKDVLRWSLLPLHSSITAEEQQRVFHPVKPGFRKVILATNIAESSITVTDITHVIDFCLTKSISCDPQTNYSCLRLEWASQDQCVQRRGRVGRVSEGHVFRMITRKVYTSLNKETIPDMEKACLENVILSVKTLDLGSPTALMALAIDPPAQSGIKLAISNLKEVGALTIEVRGVYKAYDGDLTMMGSLMAKLPFDIRYSRLIALGHVFGVLEESVIIAAGLSVKSAFSFPFTQRLLAYLSKLMWSNETFSDCFAIINLYRTWTRKNADGELRDYNQMRKWKQAYFVQLNVLREMNLCIQDVVRRLRGSNIFVDVEKLTHGRMSPEQALMLKIVLAGAFYPNYFVRFRPEPTQYARQVTRELNASDPLVTLVYTGFPNEQPGELYAAHIAQKFECLNTAPYVSVNGSKAVARFDHRGDKIGTLSVNLFRGVKMRQLRHQIIFRGTRCDIAKEICDNELELAKTRIFPAPKQCVLPGINENYMLVSVTWINSPGDFWVMYSQELQKFMGLTNLLNAHIDHCPTLNGQEVVAGNLCLVRVRTNAYRARIEYVSTDKADIMLFLIDVGDVVWRTPKHCFALSGTLLSYDVHRTPGTAMNCRIFGVKPLVRYSGTWSARAAEFIAEVVARNDNILVMDVFSVVDGVIACDMFGRDADGLGRDIGVRTMLLSDNLAAETEDPKPSLENQNYRKNVSIVNFGREDIERHNLRQRNDSVPPILLKPPVGKSCLQDYTLKGPFSPLEMSFRALSSSTHTKSVTVEGCSINSVALDQDPGTPAAVVLIAAGVGISQRSGSVILRETTLMPHIPGLVAMLTMLFCPTMQLRSEGGHTRYTGCLSGLGKDYATGESVYADHDMEVTFDTVFDAEDIRTINGIRETMNMVLNGAYQTHKNFCIDTMRKSVRADVTRLLERTRSPAEEVYPYREFRWNDDPSRKPVNVTQSGPNGQRVMSIKHRGNDVFPIHSLEVLPPTKTEAELELERRNAAAAAAVAADDDFFF